VSSRRGDWFRPKSLAFWSKRMFFGEVVRQLSLLFCFRNRHHFIVDAVIFIFASTESENTSIYGKRQEICLHAEMLPPVDITIDAMR